MLRHVFAILTMVIIAGASAGGASAQAIITYGGTQLGVNREGNLGVPGGSPSQSGTTVVGFRASGTEALASGCLCEGWGVAIGGTGIAGFANLGTDGGPHNLSVASFVSDASSAVSVVNVIDPGSGLPALRVTHDYHTYPKPPWNFPDVFEVTVTIANPTAAATPGDILYRRVMDWAVEPVTSPESVTLTAGTKPSNVAFTSDDGFETANPLVNHMNDLGGCGTGSFFECGAADHGALFQLAFAPLGAEGSLTFHEYYFVSGGQPRFTLSDLAAEVWSFSHSGPPYVCEPVVDPFCDFGINGQNFVFAMNGVGGIPVIAEPATVALLAVGLLGLGAARALATLVELSH